MKFSPEDIADLSRLAVRLDKAAKLAIAKAEEHRAHGEIEESMAQDERATSAKHFITVLHRVCRQMKEVEAPGTFKKPTLEEVKAYIWTYSTSNRLPKMPDDEVEGWYDHFQSNGWKVSGKTVMKDWQSGIRNGYRRWNQKQAERTGTQTRTAEQKSRDKAQDPNGWAKFLESKGKPYKPYLATIEFLRDEFNNQRPFNK